MIKQGIYKISLIIKSNINFNPPLPVSTTFGNDVLKLNILNINAINPINKRKLIILIICEVVDGILIILDKA